MRLTAAPALPSLALGLLCALGCGPRPGAPVQTSAPTCPACKCECGSAAPPTTGTAPTVTGTTSPGGSAASPAQLSALLDAAHKKSAKRDGRGCLADLDAAAKLDPPTVARMEFLRAQCTMLAGRCDDGKALARRYLSENTDMLTEQVSIAVDSYASMYCEGKMSDRDALLRASMQLSRGAYQGNIGIRACEQASATVARLVTSVRPRDDDDHQISSLPDHWHFTAAACFARAGDCAAAWRVFDGNFKLAGTDPRLVPEMKRTTFDSVVPKCKGRS